MRLPWGRRDEASSRELEAEIEAHLAMAAADRMSRGEAPDPARDAVRREFGNVGQVRELTRDAWGAVWLDRLVQDLRYAVRTLRRAPVFSAVAIATLALGIGANTAMFTVVRGILLRPLPYPQPASLVLVEYIPAPMFSLDGWTMEGSDYAGLGRSSKAFSSLGGASTYPVTLLGAGDPVRAPAAGVTVPFFRTLGVRPVVGRWFNDGEDGEHTAPVVIISSALWRSRFGGDTAVIGRSITIDGVPKTIVGIMPANFDYPLRTQVWEPLTYSGLAGSDRWISVVGRLSRGATLPQARTELQAFALQAGSLRTGDRGPTVTAVIPLHDAVVGDVSKSLWIFSAAVALVLLIACANVSNLLAMRARTRSHELAIRTAIGASRGRLIRQVLTESLLLSGIGGAAGLGVAVAGEALLMRAMPPGLLPRTGEVRVDLVVLAALALGCIVAGVLAGGTAAALAIRQHPRQAMSDAVRATSRGRFRGIFVTVEVALALVLLVAAGLLIRSFTRLRSADLGFTPTHLVAATLDFPEQQFPTADLLRGIEGRVASSIAAIPGVMATAAINFLPLDSSYIRGDFLLKDGRKLPGGYSVIKPAVTPSYFAVMGIPIRQGRGIFESDVRGSPRVAVVSEAMARRFWPGRSAIGEQFSMNDHPAPDWITIVGVAADVSQQGPAAPRPEIIYQPIAQMEQPFWISHFTFIVRDTLPERVVIPAIRQAVRAVDGNQPIGAIFTMDRRISDAVAEPRFRSTVLVVFSALALALATIGVYGVLAYAVAERTRELGIRMALGAAPAAVLRLMLASAARVTIPGLAIGLALSVAATRVLAGFLYEVRPTDPSTLAGASAVLLVVSLLAGLGPALRASRIDPVATIK